MKIEKEQLQSAYDKIPENIKAVFDAEETALSLMTMGKKYNLHVDQIGQLTNLVHYVLLGLLPQKNFISELKNTVGVSGDVANLIIYDLNQKILSKIRQELEEMSQGTSSQKEEKSVEAPIEEPNQTQEIEPEKTESTPSPTPTPTISNPTVLRVFDEKMRGVANVPKQEVAVTAPTSDNKMRDPYREPPI